MKNYTYHVIAKYDGCEIEVKTNSVETAICALVEHAEKDALVAVTDGYTGEILVVTNCENPYMTDEWSLMLLGWMMVSAGEVE